jgi:hypothetical protein
VLPAFEPLWRILRGDRVMASFVSKEVALQRFRTLDRRVSGHAAKLIGPDGTVAAGQQAARATLLARA